MTRRITHRLKCLMACTLFFSVLTMATAVNPKTAYGQPPSNASALMDTCKLICPADITVNLGSGECNAIVNYDVQTTGDCLPSLSIQTAGLPSGSPFPIGLTANCFTIDLDSLGFPDDDTTCCFNVVVNEFPNPVTSLVCTDLAFISLDGDCQYCINASEVMEGGPYRCFDKYLVELDKIPPYGNGPWTSGCVGATDINKTYQVRITDPVSGNKCWGNVTIEDKVAPALDCSSTLVPCNFPDLSPAYTQTSTFTLRLPTVDSLPRSIGIDENFVFNIPVGVDAVVNDVDCRVNINYGLGWNVKIEVISPAGTSALIWDGMGGCGLVDPIIARFDDEGLVSNLCNDLSADLNLDIMTAMGYDSLGVFDGENVKGTWQIKVSNSDPFSFGQVALAELLELYINMTAHFSAGFPNGLSGNCVQATGNNQYLVPAGCGNPKLDNCSAVTLSYVDTTIPDDCSSGLAAHINRTWTATDASGNITTCTQRIDQFRPSLADVVLPPNYDAIDAPAMNCTGGNYPTPDWISSQGLQGEPLLFGFSQGCNVNWSYTDLNIKVCDGTYKILRTWAIIDWCTGESLEHNQIIKVIDNQGPTFSCPSDQSVSTDPFTCCATVNLPDAVISDDCSRLNSIHAVVSLFNAAGQQTGTENVSGDLTDFPGNNLSNPDTLGAFGSTTCLPKGVHIVEYFADDNCGNTATCSFKLTVNDYTPPVAACDEITVVAIGIDDPADCFGPEGPNGAPAALDDCHFGGVSWVKATAFDDGSYDNCGNVKMTIRRTAPYSSCILKLNQLNGHAPCNDFFPDFPSEFENAISEGDSIKFYSCEVGTTQSVILRVYQLDANGNIALNANGLPIFNECIIQVSVEDKIKPVCMAPADVSVSCEQLNPTLSVYGAPNILDNCCLDTTYSYLGQCGLNQIVNYSNFDTICNKGTILRRFQAFDCNGNSSTCTQRIVVDYLQDYYVHFPNDVIVTNCGGGPNYGQPTFFGEDCELLATSYEDEVFTIVPDACYKIERTWSIINWCTYNPGLPAITVPNPQPNPVTNHPANLPGPIVSACNAQAPWNPTVVKINPTDPAATNFCDFWDANANRYEYLQIIKVIDTQEPEIANCPTSPASFADASQNNPELWNNVYNPALPIQDLAEGDADLSITSSDDCSGSNLPDIHYQLFLDLDNDGVLETVVLSNNLLGADTIRYNSLNTPGYLGGTPKTFDQRPVPTNQKWHFALQRTTSGQDVTTSVRWNTELEPGNFVVPQLPQGTHKIKWFVGDNCGNETVCEHTFSVLQDSTSGTESLDKDGFALFQNEPNPFNARTSIGFQLPDDADATLKVFDGEGRLIFSTTDRFHKGYNSIPLEGSQLQGSSVLYYRLESGKHVAWKKMLMLR